MKHFIALAALCCASTLCLAGSWGAGSFENDAALDWVNECTEANGASSVSNALEIAIKTKYIDADQGAAAVAAAEVVAAALGKPSSTLPAELRAWLARQDLKALARLAPRAAGALQRVKDPKVSELKQLWSEGNRNDWDAGIKALQARLVP